ncbi:helix-turn-helix domain-containing protein [Streptomyces sp. URMC 129]|uniref:helix-turn-helix domain-containing protein n=1 Tax=Streptomyces sp. URMC 129 TaxID=3423407 RepID=UPI003F1A8C34
MEEDAPPKNLTLLQGFGFEVRQVREGRKLTQKQLAQGTGYSEAYVSKVEGGQIVPSEKFVRGCDLVFGTSGLFERLRHRIEESDHPAWFVPYVQMERKASRKLDFSPSVICGLLQTERYARAIFRAAHPRADADIIEAKVAARLRRREIFDAPRSPALWSVLHEAALRTAVGGPDVLAEQLDFLLAAVTQWHVDLQVLPYAAGAPVGLMRPIALLSFDDAPTVLFSDGPRGGRLYDQPKTVGKAQDDYDRIRAHALSPVESLAFIKSLSKEYRS